MKIGDIDIEIRRSKRSKTITVNIERDCSVNAIAPMDCPDETIRKELAKSLFFVVQVVPVVV